MTIPAGARRESDDEVIARLRAEDPALQRKLPLEPGIMTELALLPEFTPGLLAETGIARKIPGGAGAVLDDEAVFDSRPVLAAGDGSLQFIYWVRRDARVAIGSQVRLELGLKGPRDLLAGLRRRIGKARGARDAGLDMWAEVVDLLLHDLDGRAILDAVAAATASRAGQIVQVIASFADVLGGSLPLVVDRARTLLAVKVRQDEAARALATYQNRPGIEGWIAAALSDAERWAIHLRGGGGVGKTMLLRYVASPKFADDYHTEPFTAAGVDFDHLDPRYPLTRPLLLFEALESQLVSPASVPTAELKRAREQFLDAAAAATEVAAGTLPDQRDPVAAGIRAFADLVRLTGRQVVLVFDTAEELAKVAGTAHDSSPVEATLKRLEELQGVLRHNGQPPVRVIFAGRRPLRTRPGGVDATPGHIGVCQVEGFDRAEAVRYLRRRIPETTDDLVESLLDRSGPARGDEEQRFNPFELAIWASWVIDEKKAGRAFDLNALSSYADPYVQHRILGRISEPAVRALVGPAALLGRFDRRLLEPTARRAGFDPRLAIQTLADQEWVDVVSRDDEGFPLTLAVDEHLQDRLRAAVMAPSSDFPLDRRRLAGDIRAEIDARDLAGQPADPFVALIRLLAPDDDASGFWRDLEQRVARENAWGWADGLIRRVEPAVAPGAALLAAITATKAAVAVRRPGGSADAPALWRAVVEMVSADPAAGHWPGLLARAHFALVDQGIEPTADDVRIAPVDGVAGAAAAALGGGGGLWRRAEKSGWFAGAIVRLGHEGGFAGSALAGLAGARMAGNGADLLAQAQVLTRVPRPDLRSAEGVAWVDWAPPEGLAERCALAAISWTPLSAFADRETTRTQGTLEDMAAGARARLHDIDAERFAAAYLLRRLLAGVVTSDELDTYEYQERAAYTPGRRPAWELHRATPRLIDVVALGWAGLGAPERAENILRDRIEQAVRAGTDPDAVADAQTALVRLFREYRVALSSWSLGELQAAARAEADQAVRLVGEARKGIRMSGTGDRGAERSSAEPPVVMLGHVIPALRRLEIEALDRPEATANELFELARGQSGGQEVRADMAYVLGVLACARAGIPVPENLRDWRMRSETFGDPARLHGRWASGWTQRLRVARAYAGGGEQAAREIASGHPSPELDLALPPPVQANLSGLLAPDSPPEDESTVAPGTRRLTRVRFNPPQWVLVMSACVALMYGVVLGFVYVLVGLGLHQRLPLWSSLVVGALGAGVTYVAYRSVLSWVGAGTIFARRVLFSVEYPDEGPVVRLDVSTGPRSHRFRRMSSRAASIYSALDRRRLSSGRPAVSLSAAPDDRERFIPPGWRVPRSIPLSGVLIAELDVPPVLCTLPWERWLAAASRKPKDRFVWIRSSPGWPEAVTPKGPARFAGPDYLANEKVVRLELPAAGLPSLAMTAVAGDDRRHDARLIHIVGVAVQTSAGWRLRVEGGGSRREAPGSAASPRREGLVAPTDLVTDGAGVVVLQAPPIAVGAEPFAADREGWFAFAADVLEAGAASVLTVPPLGGVQAEKAVDITTSWALRTPDDLQPRNVVRLLNDLSRLVTDVSDRRRRPRAQDDVVGFIRLIDAR